MAGRRSAGDAAVDEAIGKRLRMMRNRAGISQEKLGEALGLTFQQVQKYEKGVNRIGARQLETMASALKCTISDILGPVGGASPDAARAVDFMSTRDGQELSQAYMAMTPRRRAAILGLIRDLGT